MLQYLARLIGADIEEVNGEKKMTFSAAGVGAALTDIAIGGAAGFLPTFFIMKKKLNNALYVGEENAE